MGERVLEACCGTGALALRLAESGRTVVGVDLSPKNIEFARRRAEGVAPDSLRFEVRDVSTLDLPEDGPYDLATVILALHEMPDDARVSVLAALLRIAERVMVVDFAVPMPWNLAGARNRTMELAAGLEHFTAFRSYTRAGGLDTLVTTCGARTESSRTIDSGTLEVAVLRR